MADTKTLTLELPSGLAEDMQAAGRALMVEVVQRGLRDLRIEQALERYRQGISTFGAAAEYAGLSRSELAIQAYARSIEPPFSNTTVQEELR